MKTSGISGNEMYCLVKQGFNPGEIAVGNSVYSIGMIGSLATSVRNIVGGEVYEVTEFIQNGRELAIERLEAEAKKQGEIGITDVGTELIRHFGSNNIEFLSIGSGLYRNMETPSNQTSEFEFSSSIDGTELYCNHDAGYQAKHFVFGNVAYAIGAVGGFIGSLKTMTRGEVKEYSDVLNNTRHLALQRIVAEAKQFGANAVLNIETRIMPYTPGITEMVMIGTASHNPALGPEYTENPLTSDLISTELWSITKMGYQPLKLVMGTSVYSLGIIGGLKAAFKSFFKGEISDLTTLIYEARENAIGIISNEAKAIGADDVIGTKVYMYDMGNGLLEFMALGTAVKKVPGLTTKSEELIPQAIIVDKNTFLNSAQYSAIAGGGAMDPFAAGYGMGNAY